MTPNLGQCGQIVVFIQIIRQVFLCQNTIFKHVYLLWYDITAIYYVLERCLKIKEKLNLKLIVCVFAQAIYCKAMEIKWKEPEKFAPCVIMLGIFHTIMMYLGIIGKRFRDAGLRDLLVQSEVIAEGSVDRALSGKMYNQSVRYVKILHEAFSEILLDMLHNNLEQDDEQKTKLESINIAIQEMNNSMSQEKMKNLMLPDEFVSYEMLFIDFIDALNSTGGNLTKSLVELLLNILYATRAVY